jgi:hypothetical protein
MVIKSLVWIALQVAAEVTVRALCALAALPALITVKQIATSQMVLPRCPPYDHIIFITNGLHQLSSTTTSSPVKYDFLRASAPNDLRPWIEHDLPQEAQEVLMPITNLARSRPAARAIPARSPLTNVMPAISMATSVPVPIAIPTLIGPVPNTIRLRGQEGGRDMLDVQV